MHETDMTKALMVTVRDWWEAQGNSPQISRIHLIVGQFTCVEPASLQFAFAVQTHDTFLEGAELAIRETPLIAFCYACQQEYRPEIGLHYACPNCQSPMEDIRSGRELKIDRIEYESPVPPLISPVPPLIRGVRGDRQSDEQIEYESPVPPSISRARGDRQSDEQIEYESPVPPLIRGVRGERQSDDRIEYESPVPP